MVGPVVNPNTARLGNDWAAKESEAVMRLRRVMQRVLFMVTLMLGLR